MHNNKIILGTAQFGLDYGINNKKGRPTYETIKEILDLAHAKKIIFLDTAEGYGNSHEIIGDYHRNSNNKFEVITKFSPLRKDFSNNISERIKHHLRIMNIDSIYCYMFHSYIDFKKYFNLFRLDLLELKKKGVINKIGVSLHSNNDMIDVLKNQDIELIQLPYNLFDNKNKREKVILKAKKLGIEIHTRSTFLQGLFFKDIASIEGELSVLKKYLFKLQCIIDPSEINNLALNYVYSNPNIDAVLIGVDSVSQLKNNISCVENNKYRNIFDNINLINVEEENMLNPANW